MVGGMTDASALGPALEAILFVADEPLPSVFLAQALETDRRTIEDALGALQRKLTDDERGIVLREIAGGWRLSTSPDVREEVERFILTSRHARLTKASLETLAIVAYKQPISRAQVASIRGVDPDGVLRTLQARGYVTEVGRDAGPGQAILFGTTSTFLEKLGLDSLADLPAIGDFVPGADVVEALEQGLRVEPSPSRDAG